MPQVDEVRLPVFGFGNPEVCVYCGQPAESRDHVIDVSYQSTHNKWRLSSNGPWCWACMSCNRRLARHYFDTFKERCQWNTSLLQEKVKPVKWYKREVEELDYSLKTYVKGDVEERLIMFDRADFYGSPDFYRNIESLTWQAKGFRQETTAGKFIANYFDSIVRDIEHEIYANDRWKARSSSQT